MAESDGVKPPRGVVKATEPVANALAGKRWFPLWAIVHHRGRRSGTAFATPVAIVPAVSKTTIVIGLPWGPKTNWARNVVAAGGATLTWKGREHPLTDPRIVVGAAARAFVKPLFRPVIGRFPAALVLRRPSARR